MLWQSPKIFALGIPKVTFQPLKLEKSEVQHFNARILSRDKSNCNVFIIANLNFVDSYLTRK